MIGSDGRWIGGGDTRAPVHRKCWPSKVNGSSRQTPRIIVIASFEGLLSFARGWKRQPQVGELVAIPAIAQPENQATTREIIHVRGQSRGHHRMAVQRAADVDAGPRSWRAG